jgi:hypothetical protein
MDFLPKLRIFISPSRATSPTNLINFDLIVQVTSGKEGKLWGLKSNFL